MSPAAGELGSRRVATSSNISVMGRKPVKFNDLDGSEGRKKHGKKTDDSIPQLRKWAKIG